MPKLYLDYSERLFAFITAGAGLRDLMAFWTGWKMLPPGGEKLWVQLDYQGTQTSLAESKACFNRLIINSSHTDYATEEFLVKSLKIWIRRILLTLKKALIGISV